MTRKSLSSLALAFAVFCPAVPALGAPSAPASPKPFVYEFSYKVKWGHMDEFLELYKKNHLPILREEMKRGEILSMSAAFPIDHANESARWDFRMTITYRDAAAAFEDPLKQPWVKELFPDQATWKREEQQRFELLLEHTDVPVAVEDAASW